MPMILHTKQKSKIRSHEPKNNAIKGNDNGTIERMSKTKGVAVIAAKVRAGALEYMKKRNRKTYHKVPFLELKIVGNGELTSSEKM